MQFQFELRLLWRNQAIKVSFAGQREVFALRVDVVVDIESDQQARERSDLKVSMKSSPTGVMLTRYSWVFVSLGTPIIMGDRLYRRTNGFAIGN